MSSTPSPAGEPEYFTRYKNFGLSRSAGGVLTLRFRTDGGPRTFDGTTHHDLPRLLEDIAFDPGNRLLVLTGNGDSFIPGIDGPSLGDLTKPMGFDVMYTEGRRGVQRLVDLEIPIIAAVNGPAPVHSEYALLADVVVASDTTVFSDMPHLALGIALGDGNRAPGTGAGSSGQSCAAGSGAPRAQELAEQMTQRPNLISKYMAVVFRQRISRRLAEGMLAGMALEA